MSYQKVTGPLMANSHPGSYCGQDAYSDMLVTESGNELCNASIRSIQGKSGSIGAQNKGLQGCNGLNYWSRGGMTLEHEQPIMMSDKKGHNGISEDGVGTTLTAQEKDRPIIGDTVVRRLTVLECERLQGFPDNYTNLGDWVDSKGKKHKDADSPRYKALGNSLCIPFWFFLLRRISALYERPATLGSLFDGIGGFPLAWERCNGEGTAIWASEIEEFPMAVTKKHFPKMRHLGDITKINGAEIPAVDCITGGSPCQDLSVAGKRAGLDGERSGLFLEQIRVVKEMRENDRKHGRTNEFCRPRHLVWENVPGALSSPGKGHTGEDFRAVLTEIVKIVRPECPDIPLPRGGRWAKSGGVFGIGSDGTPFSVCWRVHDAQFWGTTQEADGRVLNLGTPQRRKRISLVADFGSGYGAAEVLFERKGLCWHSEPSRKEGETASGSPETGAGESNEPG